MYDKVNAQKGFSPFNRPQIVVFSKIDTLSAEN